MTVAITTDYNDTRDQIITDALILLGIMNPDESLSANDATLGQRFLNRLVKYWEASGAHVWTDATATVWLTNNANKYLLGPAVTDTHWANTFVETDTTAALTTSATAVTCTTTTGMTIGDFIGITLDNSTLYWTTIATIPTSTTLTLTVGVTAAAASGALVYTYTTKPQRPLRIIEASTRSSIRTNIIDILLAKLSIIDYQQISTKFSQAAPAQYVYEPKLISGVLTVWPVPTVMTDRIYIYYNRPMFDFDTSINTADIPQEWLQCLVLSLATSLAPAYGKSSLVPILKAQADEMFSKVNGYDQDPVSMFLVPTRERD